MGSIGILASAAGACAFFIWLFGFICGKGVEVVKTLKQLWEESGEKPFWAITPGGHKLYVYGPTIRLSGKSYYSFIVEPEAEDVTYESNSGPHFQLYIPPKPKTKMFAYLVSVGDGVMGPKYAVGFEDHEGRIERRAPWLDGEIE